MPHLWSIYPAQIQAGNYQVIFSGSNFAPGSVATANGIDIATIQSSEAPATSEAQTSGFWAEPSIQLPGSTYKP